MTNYRKFNHKYLKPLLLSWFWILTLKKKAQSENRTSAQMCTVIEVTLHFTSLHICPSGIWPSDTSKCCLLTVFWFCPKSVRKGCSLAPPFRGFLSVSGSILWMGFQGSYHYLFVFASQLHTLELDWSPQLRFWCFKFLFRNLPVAGDCHASQILTL